MTNGELMLECLKVAVQVSSPSSSSREEVVATIAQKFYDKCNSVNDPVAPRAKPGPKPKVDTPVPGSTPI